MSHAALHVAHVAAIGPALIYVGANHDSLPDSAYTALLLTGVFILFYHAYKAWLKLKNNQSAWVNWIHVFLVAPLLILVGYYKNDAARRYFEMILLLGFAAVGYHGYYLIRDSVMA
jgi:hypothetical protein